MSPLYLALLSCTSTPLDPGPEVRLAFAGDVTLARSLNQRLASPEARHQMLAEVVELRQADLTLVNAEGVISRGGRFYSKGEPRPFMYRARPEAIDLLVEAGVDVVAIGNNHAMDYGPTALTEMTDRLLEAHIDYTGAGLNINDARGTAYRHVNGLNIAFIGADLTYGFPHQAVGTQPGTFWLPGMKPEQHNQVVDALRPLVQAAKKRADLVFFTPHWGDNFNEAPTPATRALAKALIGLGFDGILGHSSHLVQGLELIDGRPVIYDAGNVLNDSRVSPKGQMSGVFTLYLARGGVKRVEMKPYCLGAGITKACDEVRSQEYLERFRTLTEALGSAPLTVKHGVAVIELDPPQVASRSLPAVQPRPPRGLHLPEPGLWLKDLPEAAVSTDVRWENGVQLVGYQVLMDELYIPKAGNVVTLYFRRGEQELPDDLQIELRGVHDDRRMDRHPHGPGDWMVLGSEWKKDSVLRDQSLIRHQGSPTGMVELQVGLIQGRRAVPITASNLEVAGPNVVIAQTPYTKNAQRLWSRWPRP